jgi:predicted nucleic acid-binding Zn ribbon protein
MALRDMSVAEIDDEVGYLFEEAYLASPDDDCIDHLADLYELPTKTVRAVLKYRDVEEKVRAQSISRNREIVEIERRISKIATYLKYTIIVILILLSVAVAYFSMQPVPDDRTQIEKGADMLCDIAGGCH